MVFAREWGNAVVDSHNCRVTDVCADHVVTGSGELHSER